MTVHNHDNFQATSEKMDQLALLRSSIGATAGSSGAYEGAGHLGSFAEWNPALRSADADNIGDMDPAKARARDLVRNSGIAKNAKRINRDNVVGPGLRLSLTPDHELLGIDKNTARKWGRYVQKRFNVYANGRGHHADVRRMRTFNQMTQTMADSIFEDGEGLAVRTWRKPQVGQTAGTAFQLVNPDRLSNPHGTYDRPGLRNGVYSNRYGEPTHYAIREAHPADGQFGEYSKIMRWKKIKRIGKNGTPIVMHVFDHDHAEMTRGMTEYATAIKPLKMLQRYKQVTLERAIVQAMYALTLKTEMNYGSAMEVMGRGFQKQLVDTRKNPLTAMALDYMKQARSYHERASVGLDGAQMNVLLPNEEMQFHRAEGADANFEPFEKTIIREIAAALGTPVTALSQNYADVNYSAARASLLDVWRHYMAKRALIIEGWCWPAFAAWLEDEILTGAIELPDGVTDFYAARDALLVGDWFGVGKPMIDPNKERDAQLKGLAAKIESRETIAANEGRDWLELAEQNEDEQMDALERKARLKSRADELGVDLEPAKPEPEKKPEPGDENE